MHITIRGDGLVCWNGQLDSTRDIFFWPVILPFLKSKKDND